MPLVLTTPSGNGPFPVIVGSDMAWGSQQSQSMQKVIQRGYAVCEFDRASFGPDSADRKHGTYLLDPSADCGAIAAWAWGYSRVIDYLITRPDVDARRIIVSGHSRGGKGRIAGRGADDCAWP